MELKRINNKIIKIWKSQTGWFWLATEKAYKQDSVIDGKVYENDQIYYGYVMGTKPEWGYFSSKELELLSPKVLEIQ